MSTQRTILFATDFSSASDAAFEQACLWAQSLHARLLLLHVIVESRRAPNGAETRNDERRHAEEKLLAMLDAQSSLQLDSHFIIRQGAPAREIVACAGAEQVDLIVVGTHGRTGVAYWALGSVAEKVLRNASVPVMVVRMSSRTADDTAETDAEKRALEQRLTPSSPVDEGPAIALLERAVAARATDIHLDPLRADEVLVRFRIDGQLTRYCALSRGVAGHLMQRFKLLGSLDIAEPFHAQEGRLTIPPSLGQTEVRVTCAPVAGGEAMTLRLSSRDDLIRPLASLGLSAAASDSVDSMLRNGEGVVLVTGPTGSGKTTTVYTMLSELAGNGRNIVSVEDPVEHEVPFVRQLAVDERHGITMTVGLKTVLRMDPDVIFMGEIRDAETADIAMRAAASGKYVFSTLHSRDAASTITACRDLAITNHSLAGNLVGVISQRLLRRLCPHCREQVSPTDEERALFEAHGLDAPSQMFRPQGCEQCCGRGYWGRIGAFEAICFDEQLKDAISSGASEHTLRDLLRSSGAASLLDHALALARDGVTAVSEALAMCSLKRSEAPQSRDA